MGPLAHVHDFKEYVITTVDIWQDHYAPYMAFGTEDMSELFLFFSTRRCRVFSTFFFLHGLFRSFAFLRLIDRMDPAQSRFGRVHGVAFSEAPTTLGLGMQTKWNRLARLRRHYRLGPPPPHRIATAMYKGGAPCRRRKLPWWQHISFGKRPLSTDMCTVM